MRGADQTNAVGMEVVTCASWTEFVQRCGDDIARGGMFLPTHTTHEVWTLIDVALRLPAGHEVILRGRVVHVIDAAAAALKGMPPGIGIEFIELDGPRLAALNQMLHYARTEGSSAEPRYSFAQWLAQNASFQAPQQVMASLPPAASASQPPADAHRRRRRTDRPEVARPMKPDTAQSAVRRRSDAPAGSGGAADAMTRPGQTSVAPQPQRSMSPQPTRSVSPQPMRSVAPRPRRSMSPPPTGYTRDEHSTRYSMRPPTGSGGEASSSRPPTNTSSRPVGGRTTLSGMQSPARASAPPVIGPHPTRDPESLKLGMAHLAQRRYRDALGVFRDMLERDADDIDAQRWVHMASARQADSKGQTERAVSYFRKVLEVDPANREAKDKLANLERNAKLANLPFGRFFSKK